MQDTESCPQTRGFGVFEVDFRSAELRKRGVRIKLQEQPFQILSLLLEHPGEVVTREGLRQKLWSKHTFVDFDRSLNKAMNKLRSALGDSAENPRFVETIPRHGYRFLAPVHTRGEESSLALKEQRPASDKRLVSGACAAIVPAPFSNSRGHADWKRISALTVISLALLAAIFYVTFHRGNVLGGSNPVVNARRSVAVLAFKNLSGDPREAWLSTALSDWLMTELTAGEQLRAIPAETVARMKMELALPDADSLGQDTLARIRRNLGTDLVVVGSYATLPMHANRQIRLDLRLQDTRNGETVYTVSEIGTEESLLSLVSRAGEHLREKLGIRAVTTQEAAEVAIALPSRPEAAKLYSEGLAKLRVFDSLAARDLLVKAVAAEPDFALSHAELATAWARLGYDKNANLEARKAFDLSSNLSRAERLLVEGRYREMSQNWTRAIEIYRALFDFYPDSLDYGLALASAQYKANKWKDELETISALRRLPAPLRDDPRIDLAENGPARSLGDTKTAAAVLARAAQKAKATGALLLLADARLEQAWLFENLGRQDQVEGAVRQAKQLYLAAHDQFGVARALTLEGISLERQGDYLDAKKKYEESLAINQKLGTKLNLGNQYDNLGDVLFYLGDLSGAEKIYSEALNTYVDLGDQNGAALARLGLGDVFLELGRQADANKMYEEALETCSELGDRSREASALSSLAKVQYLTGKGADARKSEAQAIAMFEEVGDTSEAEHVRVQIAGQLLDDGKNSQAGASASHAVDFFEKKEEARYEAEANLVLAQALLAEGRTGAAEKTVEQVIESAERSHNRQLGLMAGIVAARVHAAAQPSTALKNSEDHLARVATDATSESFAIVAFEARLALGEIELNSGTATARAHLATLARDASRAGAMLIARRAGAALNPSSYPR